MRAMVLGAMVLVAALFSLSGCTAMLVGGDVSSTTAADCKNGQESATCKQ